MSTKTDKTSPWRRQTSRRRHAHVNGNFITRAPCCSRSARADTIIADKIVVDNPYSLTYGGTLTST